MAPEILSPILALRRGAVVVPMGAAVRLVPPMRRLRVGVAVVALGFLGPSSRWRRVGLVRTGRAPRAFAPCSGTRVVVVVVVTVVPPG